ncbi:MAG: transposase [Armatimonadota bacterium]|nr:transposase [Armatimonadota bacterium]
MEPTSEQEHSFVHFAGCRRFVWNWALARKREVYKDIGKGIYAKILCQELTALRRELSWLKKCQAQLLQQTLRDLDKAFEAFFEKRKRFPRFKSRKRSPHTFRFPQFTRIEDGCVVLPKIGRVKARLHREIKGNVKSATIEQESDGHWYVVFVSRIEVPDAIPACDQPCGVDLGLGYFLTLDDGTKVSPPKFYRKAQRKLKRLQRQHSRCQKSSRNRAKAKARVARQHHRTANRRNDFLHKISHGLVSRHDTLCVEDLNVSALVRTKLRGHSKSWTDAAVGSFLRMLEYKSLWNGGQMVKVGRWFKSSKTCHCCQHIQHLELSDRTWTCVQCGIVHDRDHNAAINILSEGLRIVTAGSAGTLSASGEGVRLVTASSLR